MNLVSRDEYEKPLPFDLAKIPKFDMKTDKVELAMTEDYSGMQEQEESHECL